MASSEFPRAPRGAMGGSLDAPVCKVCDELARADERYAYHLSRGGQICRSLGETLALSMGFCGLHARFLARADQSTCVAVSRGTRDARTRITTLFRRASLQDELVQDILFGARRHCPACAFAHRLAGRPLLRLMRDVKAGKAFPRTVFSVSLCFEHARQMVLRALPPVRPRLLRALRRRGQILVAMGSDPMLDEAAIGAWLPDALFPYLSSMTFIGAGDKWDAPAPASNCPVCLAQREAEHAWLGSVARNIRLGQPAWLTAPTCAEHAALCLNSLPADQTLAVFPIYIKAAIASTHRRIVEPRLPARKHRRDSMRWFDPPKQRLGDKAEHHQQDDEIPEGELTRESQCPGCLSREIAMRSAISVFLHSFGRHSPSLDGTDVDRLCLKHLAETLILAPEAGIRTRLTVGLMQSAGGTGVI